MTVWLRPRHYRLSVSFSIFDQKSRFTFGGIYGFGRMSYVTFGLLSVSAEINTSTFSRPLIMNRCNAVYNAVTCSLSEMAMLVPYISAMSSGPGTPDDTDCGIRRILSSPRSCRLRETVSSVAVVSSLLAAAQHTIEQSLCYCRYTKSLAKLYI